MLGQTQKTITIDYSVPVSTIMPQLWTSFSIFPKKSHEFSMKVLGPDTPVDQSRSLNQQSVSHNSTINIKLIGEPTSGENGKKISRQNFPPIIFFFKFYDFLAIFFFSILLSIFY